MDKKEKLIKPITDLFNDGSGDYYLSYFCGNCKEILDSIYYNYCPFCGKKIDWDREEEK